MVQFGTQIMMLVFEMQGRALLGCGFLRRKMLMPFLHISSGLGTILCAGRWPGSEEI